MNNTVTYTIDFVAAIARLEEGAKQGAKAVKQMADEIESASNFARKALESIGVGLSVAAFAAAVHGASQAADAAAKMGDRFGIATESTIGMLHAADLAGVSHEALSMVLGGMAKNTLAAAQGNVQAAAGLTQLHLVARDFIALPMDQQLALVIDRLGGLQNAALRNALAQQVLGRGAREAMGLVADGSEAFRKATADTVAWGLAINRIDAAKIEIANEAIKRARAASQGMFTTISLHLAPIIAELANQFADSAAKSHGFRDEISFIGDGLKTLASLSMAAQDIFFGLGHQIGAVGAAIAALFRGEFRAAYGIVEEADADVLQHTIETNARIEKVWAATGTSIDKAAAEVAARRQKMNQQEGDPKPLFDKQAGLYLLDVQKWAESLAFKRAAENRYYQERLNAVTAFEAGFEDQAGQGDQIREALAVQHRDRLVQIAQEEWQQRKLFADFTNRDLISVNTNLFGTLSQLMQSHSKGMFEVGKASAIANAIISTYEGAQKAYTSLAGIPFVGPALGLAAAAAAIAVGLMRVDAIRSTQFGGAGGATPVYSAMPGTSVPASPIIPAAPAPAPAAPGVVAQPRTQVNLTLVGSAFSYDTIVNELIPLLNDAIGNGAEITVNA